jgi:SAM-dependent methyltransferase
MGEAVRAAWRAGGGDEVLEVRSDADPPEELSASWLLRTEDALPELEREALRRALGRVLDVGAGAGAHALPLQARGLPVTALERSAAAVEVLRARGVRDVRLGDICHGSEPGSWDAEERWDTILLLMNGTTLVGSPEGLRTLLEACASRLARDGRILLDSTDLRGEDGGDRREDGRYVGEIQLQLSWRGRRSEPFPVLYADPDLLARVAAAAGLGARVVARAEGGAYLAEVARAPDEDC